MNDNKQKPKKIRGTMEYYDDDRLLFTPQGTAADFRDQLEKVLKGLPGLPSEPVLRGRKLMATDGCSVTQI